MADRVGQQLGKYRLIRLLGKGGFAEVYLGKHISLGAEAAIKLLLAQLEDNEELEKFQGEARTIARLLHPNIVRVFDFGAEENTPYLVMDYAPNGSLRQHLPQKTPLKPERILPYVRQVAEALHYAHDQRVIHLDVKPENMLLDGRGNVLLADFGIALALQQTKTHQTLRGFTGTPLYAAPEQLQGKPGLASDQYALATVVYYWLTGTHPFEGADVFSLGLKKLQGNPPPLHDHIHDLPPTVEQVVLTALATDPKERFANVRAFARAFEQAIQAAQPPSSLYSAPTVPAVTPPGSQPETSILFAPTQVKTPPAPEAPPIQPVRSASGPGALPETVRAATPPAHPTLGAPVTAAETKLLATLAPTTSPTKPTGSAIPQTGAPRRKRRTGPIALVALLLAAILLGGLAAFGALAGAGPLALLAGGSRPTAIATSTHPALPSATVTLEAPSGFRYYTNTDGVFAIAYPIDWQQKTTPTGVGIEFLGPAGQQASIDDLGLQSSASTTDAALSSIAQDFCKSFGGNLTEGSGTYSVPAGPAAEPWKADQCDNGINLALVAVVIHKSGNGHLYRIVYLSPRASFYNDHISYFSHMNSSFLFLDASS